jgi:hypothetical protein
MGVCSLNVNFSDNCSYVPAYEDGTDSCSEMLALKLQTPVNHPEDSIKHSEQGERLK